jgi:hypothetical protein
MPGIIRHLVALLMVAVYFSIGVIFLFTDLGFDTFPLYRTPIGITLMIYGTFRALLTWQKIRKEKQENHE